MTRAHILYSGTVQGVGFRYTVRRCAIALGLAGWVKNLRDGRVEIVVEGSEDTIQQLIQNVDRYFQEYVRDKKVTYHEPKGMLEGFDIAF